MRCGRSAFSSLSRAPEGFLSWIAFLPSLLCWQTSSSTPIDVEVQATFGFRCVCHYLHPQRLRAALPRSPVQLLLLAQNDLCRGPDLVGAFRLLPVALLALALPFAVRPPPFLTDSFSPLPTLKLGNFFLGIEPCPFFVDDESLQPGFVSSVVRDAHMRPPVKLTYHLVMA